MTGRLTPRLLLPVATLLALLAGIGAALAQPCTPEAEPNDEPVDAATRAGAFCLAGAAQASDRDRVSWTVDEAGARQLWQLELEGLPGEDGRLRIARIETAEDGSSRENEVVSEPIDTAGGRLVLPPLLLAAGRYLLTVEGSYGDGLLYRLRASAGEALPEDLAAGDVAGALTGLVRPQEDARPSILWTVDAAAADRLWTLTLQAELHASPTLELYDEQGTRVDYAYTQLGGIGTLADLGLEPGRYEIRASSRTGPRLVVSAEDAGPRDAGRVAEPNGDAAHAAPFDPSVPLTGRLIGSSSRNDEDYLRLALDETWRDQRFDLVLLADSEAELRLAVLGADGASLQERIGSGEVRLPDLVLEPGEHLLRVYGALDPAVSYTLAAEARAPATPGSEREPNDSPATASPFGAEGAAEGRFAGRDIDVFALTVEGAPELWRIEAEGAGLERLTLYDTAGNVIVEERPPVDAGNGRLSSLLLVPGRHLFGVTGVDGSYRLTATRLGPPPAPGTPIAEVLARGLADELEPNDDPARAIQLEPGVPRSGMLDRAGDVDLYRFYLAAETRVRITIDGPPGSTIVADPQWGERRGVVQQLRTFGDPAGRSQVVWDGVLGPGDHYLPVRAEGTADGPYALLLEHRPWFERPVDVEPNDEFWLAPPLPADLTLSGTLAPRDADWYRLPDLDRPATLTIRDLAPETGTMAGMGIAIVRETAPDPADLWPPRERESVAHLYQDRDTLEWRAELPAGAGYHLGLSGNSSGAYTLALDFGGVIGPGPVEAPPVAMTLALETDTVAAFATAGQRVAGTLSLTNRGSAPLALVLTSHSGDERWQVTAAETELALPAGATAEVAVTVEIAPDAWAARPVAIAVAATAAPTVTPAFAEAAVTPELTAPLVDPYQAWPVPETMLGGLDVAGTAAGGALLIDEARLTDGGVNQGTSAVMDQRELRAGQPVIDLAGDAPVTLAGVLLTPAALPEVVDRLRRFAVSTSLDGVTFERVLEASLSAREGEQAFPFAAPVQARFLRLEPIDTHAGQRSGSGATLGELKAVAVPEENPLDPEGRGLNLADPARGGHVVWSAPMVDGRQLLTADAERPRAYLASDHAGPVEWVVGFAHNRAARVTAVEWVASEAEPDEQPVAVEVFASLDSAVGPWESLGRFALPPSGTSSVIENIDPKWIRYMRFALEPPPDTRTVYLPETLIVREAPVGAGYRSALGEWGGLGRDAVYEWLNPPAQPAAEGADDNDTPETADLLAFDTAAAGTVLLDSDVDWYRIDVPTDGHGLLLSLAGTASASLQDAQGAAVPLAGSGGALTAAVSPGAYWLKLEDPPRSIALSWDTSGSVSGYIPSIVQAMRTFAEGLRPGREVVNLFPFRGDGTVPLLDEWTGDPLRVFYTLHGYPWTDSSSNAEAALLAASRELAGRPGLRAIVLLTDAQSDGANLTPELWASLAETRPRIFSLAVPGTFTGDELWLTRNLMQDWAGLNGGFYQPMLSQGEIDVAFERLAGWLRRPASYQVAVALDRTPPPPPEPGFLQVADVEPEAGRESSGAPGNGGILLILDASGSMLQRIDGVRRIEIARETLTTLTGATIPAGTTLGLRVFGQGPPDSCDTGLVVPPQPLDPARIAPVIAGIQPTNLARTPIGESLRLVPQDMAGVTGPQLVVLITDGEETCDGDPPTEIAALRAMGIDVRVNIVGFAVDDPALAQTFSDWAELGGGRYFDAADAPSLGEALTQAVQRRFSVENSRGTVVATGTVGDPPIELPAGTYTVRVDGGSAQRVAVASGETVTLTGPF